MVTLMSQMCLEETWPSDEARYWGYKEAQLRPETPRNAICLNCSVSRFPLLRRKFRLA
jgi:hypothetical protein